MKGNPEKFFKAMKRAGWRHRQRRNGHMVWICPCGPKVHRVFTSRTTSDSRAAKYRIVKDVKNTGCPHVPEC